MRIVKGCNQLQAVVDKQLTPLDSTNTPLWSTFCGLSNGVWRGKAAAFFAATGVLLVSLTVYRLNSEASICVRNDVLIQAQTCLLHYDFMYSQSTVAV